MSSSCVQSRILRGAAFAFVAGVALVSLWLQRPSGAGEADEVKTFSVRGIGAVQPRLSPDGKSIVFSYQGSIWRIPVAGGTMKRLAAVPGFAIEPCWSPDGKKIAFLHSKAGWFVGTVHVVDADTGKSLKRHDDIFGTGKIAFSADGARLLGTLRKGNQVPALRSLDIEDGTMASVVRWPAVRAHPWALSSDGKAVVYATNLDQIGKKQGGDAGPFNEVWKVAIRGGEPERLFTFPARVYDVCWSSDDQSLFVCTDLGTVHNDIWQINLKDVEKPVKLTLGQADEERPSVSRDGRWLLYNDNREGAPALVMHDLRKGDTRALTIDKLDFGVPIGRVKLAVVDRATKKPAVARVSILQKGAGYHAPPGALRRINRNYAHCFIRDRSELELPEETYEIRAWHGPEYRRLEATLEVKAGMLVDHALVFERWTDPNADHWYSGDNHVHANYGYGATRGCAASCGP